MSHISLFNHVNIKKIYLFFVVVILMSASKLWTDLMLEVTGVYQAWCVIYICKIEFALFSVMFLL